MSDFQLGDIVRLKSGGPEMVIKDHSAQGEDIFICHWFNENNINEDSFYDYEIEKIKKGMPTFKKEDIAKI